MTRSWQWVRRSGLAALLAALCFVSLHASTYPAAAQSRPQFNPATSSCSSYPSGPVMQGSWQTSAPREGVDVVRSGDTVEIGLRNKSGAPNETYTALVTVWGPDGTVSASDGNPSVTGSDWTTLEFPDDFDDNGDTDLRGVYTILWTIGPLNVACDGFTVH